jgi:hypothetical protein
MKIGVALKALRATLTEPILLFGIPFDFVLFALTLLAHCAGVFGSAQDLAVNSGSLRL